MIERNEKTNITKDKSLMKITSKKTNEKHEDNKIGTEINDNKEVSITC